MGRKYEVFVGEKRVVIADQAVRKGLPAGWLMLEVADAQEVTDGFELLRSHSIMKGLYLFSSEPDRIMAHFAAHFTPVLAAGGLVLNQSNELLAIHRLGVWDLPKGKVDKGESIEQAAIREVKEECGLVTVELGDHLIDTYHTYERGGNQHLKRTVWYRMQAGSDQPIEPQTEENIDIVVWLGKNELVDFRANTYGSILRVLEAWEGS